MADPFGTFAQAFMAAQQRKAAADAASAQYADKMKQQEWENDYRNRQLAQQERLAGAKAKEGGIPLEMLFPQFAGSGATVKGAQAATFMQREGEKMRKQDVESKAALAQAETLGNLLSEFVANPKAKELFPENQAASESWLSPAAWGSGKLKAGMPGYGTAAAQIDQIKSMAKTAGKQMLGSIGPITEREWPIMEQQLLALNYRTPWPQVQKVLADFQAFRERAAKEAQDRASMGFSPIVGTSGQQAPAADQDAKMRRLQELRAKAGR